LAAPFRALALAPLCVAPDRQHRGIGSRLVRAGLEWARDAQWEAVFVLGDPAYYRRFGFALEPARSFDSPYAGEHFMMLALRERIPAGGALAYPKAFEAL
ncbi:MAG: GNAT family N-acetyltransferase, partial [Sphingomonadales bacterium]